MSVIDLSKRIARSWEDFEKYKRSYESLIFVTAPIKVDESLVSLDLSVGDDCYDHRTKRPFSIDEKGLFVPPRSSVVIFTEQRVALPLNVFGLVTGKGKYIYREAIISPGKIDPGFNDRLRVGFYNASDNTICLKKGEFFCSCCFMNLESSIPEPPKRELSPQWPVASGPWRVRLQGWYARHKDKDLPLVFSLLAIVIALTTLVLKLFQKDK